LKKFPVLHTIASLFKILAWVVGIAAVIMCIFSFVGRADLLGGGIVTGLMILIGGAIYALILYAFAEGILVVLAIEENTRKSNKDES